MAKVALGVPNLLPFSDTLSRRKCVLHGVLSTLVVEVDEDLVVPVERECGTLEV